MQRSPRFQIYFDYFNFKHVHFKIVWIIVFNDTSRDAVDDEYNTQKRMNSKLPPEIIINRKQTVT